VRRRAEALVARYSPFVLSSLRTCGLHALPVLARTATRTTLGQRLPLVISRVPSSDSVALTFDDGPGTLVDDFLMTLDQAGATATFFLIGEQVERNPGRAAQIVQAGHEVAVHGYRHISHLNSSPHEIIGDMRRARAVIEEATGRRTRFYRPPHGAFVVASWREATRQGWRRVLWSRAGRDWMADATPGSIADWVGGASAGEVLLLHDADWYSAEDSDRRTLAALPMIFDRWQSADLQARSLGELLGSDSGHSPLAAE
jgi:peptidoglycan-N-acetylglucosamine deacetylase